MRNAKPLAKCAFPVRLRFRSKFSLFNKFLSLFPSSEISRLRY
jgi:hypothetical protein